MSSYDLGPLVKEFIESSDYIPLFFFENQEDNAEVSDISDLNDRTEPGI